MFIERSCSLPSIVDDVVCFHRHMAWPIQLQLVKSVARVERLYDSGL